MVYPKHWLIEALWCENSLPLWNKFSNAVNQTYVYCCRAHYLSSLGSCPLMFMKPSLFSFAFFFFFILPLILFSCLWNSLGLLLKNTCLKNLDLFLKKKMKGKRLVPLKILLNSHDHIKYRWKKNQYVFMTEKCIWLSLCIGTTMSFIICYLESMKKSVKNFTLNNLKIIPTSIR